MGFLWRVHGVTIRDKMRSCEMRKTLNVEPLLWIKKSQLQLLGYVIRMSKERLARPVLHPRERDPDVVQGVGGMTTSPTLIGPDMVWSQQNYLRLLFVVRYFETS